MAAEGSGHRRGRSVEFSMLRSALRPAGAAARATRPALHTAMRACASAVTKVTGGSTGVFPQAPSPLQEFSVVYTDRALNHMSEPFKKVMLDMNDDIARRR